MKIVQVTPRYPPHTGGVETQIKEISERLVERGHDVTVLSADAGGDVPTREVRSGVTVLRHRSFAPQNSFHISPGLFRTLRNKQSDTIHVHNYHSTPSTMSALTRGDSRFVFSTYYHGGSANPVRDLLLSMYKPVGEWALRKADRVVAVSEWEREHLRVDFGVDSTVVPIGIDVERFSELTPLKRGRPYLLCVSRLEEYKGVQHVIRALPYLQPYDLIVAGDGSYRTELERLAADVGVSDQVEFLGNRPSDQLPPLYAGADVYISMSEFESYGITVAEAIAAGTPCVVRTGSALEGWLDNSSVVGISDYGAQSIANAVHQAETAEPDATGIVSWETVVDRIESIYLEI